MTDPGEHHEALLGTAGRREVQTYASIRGVNLCLDGSGPFVEREDYLKLRDHADRLAVLAERLLLADLKDEDAATDVLDRAIGAYRNSQRA